MWRFQFLSGYAIFLMLAGTPAFAQIKYCNRAVGADKFMLSFKDKRCPYSTERERSNLSKKQLEHDKQKAERAQAEKQRKSDHLEAQHQNEKTRREFERAKKVESSKDFYTREQLRRSSGAVAE